MASPVCLWRVRRTLFALAFKNAGAVKKNSPYSLTNLGNALLDRSNAKDIIEQNKAYFFDKINKLPNATNFDIERASISAVIDSFSMDFMNQIKDFLYNSPDRINIGGVKEKFTINDLQVAMAVYIRDLYIEERHKDEQNKEIETPGQEE